MICYSNLSVLDTTHCHQGLAVSSTFPLMVLSSKFLGMAPHAMFPWFDMKARGKTLFPALLYPPTIPEQGLIDVDRPGLGGGACSWTNHHSQKTVHWLANLHHVMHLGSGWIHCLKAHWLRMEDQGILATKRTFMLGTKVTQFLCNIIIIFQASRKFLENFGNCL